MGATLLEMDEPRGSRQSCGQRYHSGHDGIYVRCTDRFEAYEGRPAAPGPDVSRRAQRAVPVATIFDGAQAAEAPDLRRGLPLSK